MPVFHLWDYAMSSTSMKPTPGKKNLLHFTSFHSIWLSAAHWPGKRNIFNPWNLSVVALASHDS